MGHCISRSHPDDYDTWCEENEDTIIENVLNDRALDAFSWDDPLCRKLFEEEAQKLWDICPEADDCDPRGGDSEED